MSDGNESIYHSSGTARLLMLRDHGIPFAEQKRDEGKLNFSIFYNSNDGKGCWLGFLPDIPAFAEDGWTRGKHSGDPQWHRYISFAAAEEYFGISEGEVRALFDSGPRTIRQRAEYLSDLIDRKMQGDNLSRFV